MILKLNRNNFSLLDQWADSFFARNHKSFSSRPQICGHLWELNLISCQPIHLANQYWWWCHNLLKSKGRICTNEKVNMKLLHIPTSVLSWHAPLNASGLESPSQPTLAQVAEYYQIPFISHVLLLRFFTWVS